MRIDQHAQHAERLVVLDETHAAHVGGQIHYYGRTLHSTLADFFALKIQDKILDSVRLLIPLLARLDVHGPDHIDAAIAQILYEMAADKSAPSANNNFLVLQLH